MAQSREPEVEARAVRRRCGGFRAVPAREAATFRRFPALSRALPVVLRVGRTAAKPR